MPVAPSTNSPEGRSNAPRLTLSVLGLALQSDIVTADDLRQLADTALELVAFVKGAGSLEQERRLSKLVADDMAITGAADALGRLCSAPIMQACLTYTATTPAGAPAPPDLRIAGVPDRTAVRLQHTLLRLADAVAGLTRLPGVGAAPGPHGPRADIRCEWQPQFGKPLAPPDVIEQLERQAKDLMALLQATASMEGEQRGPVDTPPAPLMNQPVDVRWPFGMVPDENGRTVRRGDKRVEFAGKEKRWLVLAALAARYPAYYRVRELGHDIWNPEDKDCDPADSTVHTTVGAVRNVLLPLRVGVSHTKGIGYRLEEILILGDSDASKGKTRKKKGARP
jgi:hypothetical protein